MARRTIFRWFVLTILTAALVASLVAMVALKGGLDEVWLYATLTLYGTALLVYWLIGAGTKVASGSDDGIAEKVAAALAASGRRSSQTLSEPEPELVVEPTRTEPIVFPTAAPAAYQFRGYTLYQRGDSRFFSKAAPPGAQTIALPSGYEATWDDGKGKPILIEVGAAVDEEPEVVQGVAQKACSAMTAPGEFCENFAKDGSKYCTKHVTYRGGDELFEVRKPGMMSPGKSQRFGAPNIEVRMDRPSAKPLKLKRGPEPSVEVRLAKPSNTKELEYKRGKAVEIPIDRATGKPLKLRPAGNVEVELDRREPEKPLRFARANEPIVRLSKPAPGKPVKFGRANEPIVRVAKPTEGKPIKFPKRDEPTLKVGKPPAPKPLRFKAGPEPSIREDQAVPKKARGKQLGASELVIKQPTGIPNASPKGKQLSASELVFKTPSIAPAKKGKQLPVSEIVVKKPGNAPAPKGKQLPASELVFKTPANASTPKGKQLSASEVVVKKPGVAKPAAPLKVVPPKIIVKKSGAARPAPARVARGNDEPEIVVVKDTKRRTMLGVAGDAPKK